MRFCNKCKTNNDTVVLRQLGTGVETYSFFLCDKCFNDMNYELTRFFTDWIKITTPDMPCCTKCVRPIIINETKKVKKPIAPKAESIV